ncbi:helix-turn-helix domain-containing protein, partial [Streptomyces triticiradicis]
PQTAAEAPALGLPDPAGNPAATRARTRPRGVSMECPASRGKFKGARRDLADPALRGLPVHVLAARWGYRRASDFTRAFRSAYGLPPTEYRFQALACDRA